MGVTGGANTFISRLRSERGFSLLEVLVSFGISTVLIGGLLQQYTQTMAVMNDSNIRIACLLEAQALLQTVGSEIRMMGNGVPFDQANFEIGENTLTDPLVTEPLVVASSDGDNISFRLNETGDVYLLTANFDPTATSTVQLTDVTGLAINDPVYISNSVMSGDDGFYGVISGVNTGANTITISAGYVVSPGGTFAMGSVLEEVPVITYTSVGGPTGITRDSGFGPVQLGANTAMSLEYLDLNGNALTPPLTNAQVVSSLRSIRVTISKTSTSKLKSGEAYTATVRQDFGIRNLNYLY